MSDKTYQSDRNGENIDKLLDYLDTDVRKKINEFDKELPLKADDSKVVKLDTKNQPNGYLGLDEDGKVDEKLIKGNIFVKTSLKNKADGYLGLAEDGKFDSSFIKDGQVVKTETKNQPNGYAGLGTDCKIDISLLPEDIATKEVIVKELEDESRNNKQTYSNTLIGFDKNTIISASDISPVEHNIGLVISSESPDVDLSQVNLRVCKGKNLSTISESTEPEKRGYFQITGVPHGTYTVSCDVTKYSDDEATNTRVSIGVAYDTGTYAPNGNKIYSYVWSYSDKDANNVERDGVTRRKTASITTNPDSSYSLWAIMVRTLEYDSAGENRNAKAENIILIKEDDANQTYSVNSDGTVDNVKSVSPDMLIYADRAGTNIDCKYNKDANKVIEKLTNAIISLGGNV